jgi:hypothetical protein
MRKMFFMLVFSFGMLPFFANAQKQREYYEITVYRCKYDQEKIVDGFLREAYLPGLHKKGIHRIGVFKPLANDTAAEKLIYVVVPITTLQQLISLPDQLLKNKDFRQNGKEYLEASYKNPPYTRMEKIVLEAFPLAPLMNLPQLKGPKEERIFELRSYESATEKLYHNKVKMFNEGGEISLFARLNFNSIFYAEVIAGSNMPNLMYMTSFENIADRDAHWKTFGADAEWKKTSSMPEYQNNVSKAEITLMHAAEYSDY